MAKKSPPDTRTALDLEREIQALDVKIQELREAKRVKFGLYEAKLKAEAQERERQALEDRKSGKLPPKPPTQKIGSGSR
ncbi:MAG: hypothetical protein AMXMBFR7_32890 [Planctomycetota bacterium]